MSHGTRAEQWAIFTRPGPAGELQNLAGLSAGFFTEVIERPRERLRLEGFGAYLHAAAVCRNRKALLPALM
jgi:hypothetical protein